MALALYPSALFSLALFLGVVLLFSRRWAGAGRGLLAAAVSAYVLFGVFPVGMWSLNVLEDRFPMAVHDREPVHGVIVLGGPVDPVMTRDRGQVVLGDGAERLTEFLRLARIHPNAKLVFSGGSGRLLDRDTTEAEISRRFFSEQGLDVSRVWFEDASRNTSESAALTYDRLKPEPGQNWVLITSARHMPRAVGVFRHMGWEVAPHPVDYYTAPNGLFRGGVFWPPKLGYLDTAVYEWGGLLVSWLRGVSDDPFPGPRPVAQGGQ